MSDPLVSFCVKSYNQRRYLRAALEGAMAQTYRPLEIVVSDDCSTDGSWEDIQSFFAARPAPAGVTVVLNRNERNLGNLGNWEKICGLAHGELLVKADGDDVSLSDRTLKIAEAWAAEGMASFAVCHSGWQIGPRGEGYGRMRRVTADWPLGAAMAYSPELFRRFPKVGTDYERCMDDEVYTRRARMLGKVLEMPDRLVKYRLGVGATSSLWKIRDQIRFCNGDTLKTLDIAERDLLTLPEDVRPRWREFVEAERHRLSLKLRQLDAPTYAERRRLTRELGRHPFPSIAHYMGVAFTMPRPVGDAMVFAYAFLRNAYWRMQGAGR